MLAFCSLPNCKIWYRLTWRQQAVHVEGTLGLCTWLLPWEAVRNWPLTNCLWLAHWSLFAMMYNTNLLIFCVYGSVHRWSILIIVQQDATQSSLFIILQVHSTCFGCQPHPSSRVHKTITTSSNTGHIFFCVATSLQRGQVGHVVLHLFEELLI